MASVKAENKVEKLTNEQTPPSLRHGVLALSAQTSQCEPYPDTT